MDRQNQTYQWTACFQGCNITLHQHIKWCLTKVTWIIKHIKITFGIIFSGNPYHGCMTPMMTSWNGNIFCVTGLLCGELWHPAHDTHFSVTNINLSYPVAAHWTHSTMTSSNGNIFRVTGPLCGEFKGHRWIPCTRPLPRSFDVFFNLRLNQPLSKQWRRRWFETPSC